MATHSSVLSWRIPGTGDPGGLPSVGRTEPDTTEATLQQQQHDVRRASEVVLVIKNLPANAGDMRDTGLSRGLGRSPGGGHGNTLQYS